jgi:muramoyltetrapeptide carboxypeptidase LdcA involved in peptidoglycan recycling
MNFSKLNKLKRGDKVAIVSPSFVAPAVWPAVYELGLARLRDVFGLVPVEFPATKKRDATEAEKAADLIAAFEDKEIKAVITTLGGDHQVLYVKNLPAAPFKNNPKPFFGYSDNTNFMNFLWQNGVPSYYGGAVFTQFAKNGKMDEFTVEYLNKALFETGEFEIHASNIYNDIGLDWSKEENLKKFRQYEPNEGWYWDGEKSAEGITWGGCLETVDELLRHNITLPSLDEFENVILLLETCEEISPAIYVHRVCRALGGRGILSRVKGLLVGRPKAWEFGKEMNAEEKAAYKKEQRETIIKIFREYNQTAPVVQNLDFGHTDPQVAFPYGAKARIATETKQIFVRF